MVCNRTAFSNSRRGNSVGTKMNGANYEENKDKKQLIRTKRIEILLRH